jgi:hypothetical protein
MYFEQVLVDRKKFRSLNLFDKIGKSYRVANFELLLRVLELLHKNAVFNILVEFNKLSALRSPKSEQET